MNKISRFFGTTVLAAGLAFSGAALTAGAASASDHPKDSKSSSPYHNDHDNNGHGRYDKDGYDKDGYNKDGYDCDGYNRYGNDRHGHHRSSDSWYRDSRGHVHYIIIIIVR
ncbi:hypothetical protein GCM10009712_18590 [Pseudarthrobacter sulfonivorans]|uniref:hypothetical protein n=1 Tax=Pseudarthrobacter sulfonivorans TaxID=121292 RepID=UPI00168B5977|nr:hypothetical protein [Pseudarthrobacter sulfonivorans]